MLARRPFHSSQMTDIDPSYVDFNIAFRHVRSDATNDVVTFHQPLLIWSPLDSVILL
jgi:hypothetical protein